MLLRWLANPLLDSASETMHTIFMHQLYALTKYLFAKPTGTTLKNKNVLQDVQFTNIIVIFVDY